VPAPDLLPDPAEVARSPAARLLVARARDALPGFRLDADNAAAVAAICRRLDGLPLALELAAPHLVAFSVETLLARLTRPLELLVDGPHDLPERQRSLRDAIAWSDDLLGPAARSLFRHLATFPLGATLDDLRTLAAAGGRAYADADLGDALATLMAQHLVRRLDDGTGDDPRYSLLATSRDYAAGHPVMPHAHQNLCGAEYTPVRRDPDQCGG